LPGASGWGRALKEMVIILMGRMAGRAVIVIAGGTAMKLFTSGKMEEAEFGDEITALLHFRIHATKRVPIHGVEGAFIPVESVLVVGDQGREASLCADSSFKALCDRGALIGKHDLASRIKGDIGKECR
jgi:hypothetical protein